MSTHNSTTLAGCRYIAAAPTLPAMGYVGDTVPTVPSIEPASAPSIAPEFHRNSTT
ncbi:hypothetical protein ARMSODRAFT_955907 [Armillaria solidipes]|uniref:Uncharacterized protein n=1 Tax=Armillaria solidipes TaxID=1076256 RepID=A0A2H3BTT3_9AGAR|nr:hypothetical protein ARMSODRAFT_957236 [Armillaria solidipes]PBK70412.1 hypothetical protein ARMSODRAFT_955907 [Armillaria solidipes]